MNSTLHLSNELKTKRYFNKTFNNRAHNFHLHHICCADDANTCSRSTNRDNKRVSIYTFRQKTWYLPIDAENIQKKDWKINLMLLLSHVYQNISYAHSFWISSYDAEVCYMPIYQYIINQPNIWKFYCLLNIFTSNNFNVTCVVYGNVGANKYANINCQCFFLSFSCGYFLFLRTDKQYRIIYKI